MALRTVLGTCHHDCPDTCGWVATVDDETGRAVKLRGNPAHPYSRGELCPKVNRFLDRVYSPDRILTPLARVGAKGEGRFEPATWEHALALTAERLLAVRAEYGGEAIWPFNSAGTQGLVQARPAASACSGRSSSSETPRPASRSCPTTPPATRPSRWSSSPTPARPRACGRSCTSNRTHVVPPCTTSIDDVRAGLAILDEALEVTDRYVED